MFLIMTFCFGFFFCLTILDILGELNEMFENLTN